MCRWHLCPSRGQEWSKAWCVGCLGGDTTVRVGVKPPSHWGRSQCRLFQLRGVTAASPLTETSQQTWYVPATGLEEKMHARYRYKAVIPSFMSDRQLFLRGSCLICPHWDKQYYSIFEKPSNQFWSAKFCLSSQCISNTTLSSSFHQLTLKQDNKAI